MSQPHIKLPTPPTSDVSATPSPERKQLKPAQATHSHGLPTPEFATDTSTVPDRLPVPSHPIPSSSVPYFQGSSDPTDYIIDIWSDRDLLDFEPDIQAYLENVSRSRYGTREFVGFTNVDDDDHYVGIEDGPYVPDTAAMARGMAILRDLAQTNNGLFFSKDEIADVIENGMAKYPHFPWMNSMSRDALDQQHTLGMDQYDRPMIGWPKDFIVFSNVRVALPPDLHPPSADGIWWRQIIGEAYGNDHPIYLASDPLDLAGLLPDADIRAQQHFSLTRYR